MRILNVRDLEIINEDTLVKSTTKRDLPSGGVWRTIRGSHVYIVNGRIEAGAGHLKGKTLAEVQEGKGAETNGKKQRNGKTKQREQGSKGTRSLGESHDKRVAGARQDGAGNREAKTSLSIGGHTAKIKRSLTPPSENHHVFHELGEGGHKVFHKAITEAKEGNAHGAFVHAYNPETTQQEWGEDIGYDRMRVFLTENGEAGFAIKEDGDIVSVFRHPEKHKASGKKGVGGQIMLHALKEGGKKMDCFGDQDTEKVSHLVSIYAKAGFKPVAQIPFNREYAPEGWNYERDGEPNVIFLAHNGDSYDKVLDTLAKGGYELPNMKDVPTVNDYDEGSARQKAFLESKESPITKSLTAYMEITKSLMKGW